MESIDAHAQDCLGAPPDFFFTLLGRVRDRNIYAVTVEDTVIGGVAGKVPVAKYRRWATVPGTTGRIIMAAAESADLDALPQFRSRGEAAAELYGAVRHVS